MLVAALLVVSILLNVWVLVQLTSIAVRQSAEHEQIENNRQEQTQEIDRLHDYWNTFSRQFDNHVNKERHDAKANRQDARQEDSLQPSSSGSN